LASLLTFGFVVAGVEILDPRLSVLFDGMDTGLKSFFVMNAPFLILIQAGGLSALSAAVSWIAVGRYIKR
jgi:hypothetical protein